MKRMAAGFGLTVMAAAVAAVIGTSGKAEAQMAQFSSPVYRNICMNRGPYHPRGPMTAKDFRFCEAFAQKLNAMEPGMNAMGDAANLLTNILVPNRDQDIDDDEDERPQQRPRGRR
jgi:hypothetical protein